MERSGEDVCLDAHEQQRHRRFLQLFAAQEAAVYGFVRSLVSRRVGLFLDPSDINEHSRDDWRLLDAAVNWCVEVALQPESLKGLL